MLSSIILAAVLSTAVRTHYECLHQHPELGKQEVRTSAYVRSWLRQTGYTRFYDVPGLPTAVITELDTGTPGPTIALRAELDARKTREATNLPFAATNGLMHNCGHDAHTSILLQTATALRSRTDLRGKIIFIFQPAEETAGGADDIVDSGILQRLGVKALFALHVAPGVSVGTYELSPGPILAGSNYFTITLTGRASHAAAPFDGDDIITCTGGIITGLAGLLSRRTDQLQRPSLLSITSVTAGDVTTKNIIPPTATLAGTIRSFTSIEDATHAPSTRQVLTGYLSAAAAACRAQVQVDLHAAAPPTYNDTGLYDLLGARIAQRWKGSAGTQARGMFSEDFSYYTTAIPSLYFSLGISKDGLGDQPVHTDQFTINEESLDAGVNLLTIIAEEALQAVNP